MKHIITWLRICYWSAAIADFGITVIVLLPSNMGVKEFVYPMALTSALAFSWGIMLLFADRKPLERRWILIPTLLVITLLTIARLYAVSAGMVKFSWPLFLLGAALIGLYIITIYKTRAINTENEKEILWSIK